MATTQIKPKIGNADVFEQLKEIDYLNLSYEHYDNYLDVVHGKRQNTSKPEGKKNPRGAALADNVLYDFQGYRGYPIKEELYEGLKDTPIITVGIKFKSNEPEMNTRITLRAANDLNAQIHGASHRTPSIYYMIKKVESSEGEEKKKVGRPSNNA